VFISDFRLGIMRNSNPNVADQVVCPGMSHTLLVHITNGYSAITCWHGIWPDGFCGVWGLTAPNGLRLRA
jgi:hypothetical protein